MYDGVLRSKPRFDPAPGKAMPMSFDEDAAESSRFRHLVRRAKFAEETALRIRAAEGFSIALLPHEELARLVSGWYEASASATVEGHYGPLVDFVGNWLRTALREGFGLTDVSEFLRICRQAAQEKEGWSEESLSTVDEAIHEAFGSLKLKLSWAIPDGFDYRTGKARSQEPAATQAAGPVAEEPETKENRRHPRNKLKIPIRVRATFAESAIEEITETDNVAPRGVYFRTLYIYEMGMTVQVTYPFRPGLGAVSREYPASVARIDFYSGDIFGVALEFSVELGPTEADLRSAPRFRAAPGTYVVYVEGSGQIEDLSLNGVFVADPSPLDIGTYIEMELRLGDYRLPAKGIVRRSMRGKGMGIEFVEMSAEDKRRLKIYLAQLAAPSA